MDSVRKEVTVTKPSLPPLEKFTPYLEQIWKNRQLTNNGPFHREFEDRLARFLGVGHVSLFANGSLALLAALKSLDLKGEVITTPYSFVATSHCLEWAGLKPVFADVDPRFGNLEPTAIKSAITSRTTAVLPVHVYGSPCRVEEIDEIAKDFNLKVVYDACHTFGVNFKDIPLLSFGDLSVLSFHATKVFTTFEGGAVVCKDVESKRRLDLIKNFGFAGETRVLCSGINAKMNEMQAALGILQLEHITENIAARGQKAALYRRLLEDVEGIRLLPENPQAEPCHPYFPIFVDGTKFPLTRDRIYEKLKQEGIFCRRYFYPLIPEFEPFSEAQHPPGKDRWPNARKLSRQVLCLPMYPDLGEDVICKIGQIIKFPFGT